LRAVESSFAQQPAKKYNMGCVSREELSLDHGEIESGLVNFRFGILFEL
jgi:hypothetical protein